MAGIQLYKVSGRDNIVGPFFVSMGIFAMYSAYGIAYNLAETLNTKGVSPMNSGMLSMFSFLLAVAPAVWVGGELGSVIPDGLLRWCWRIYCYHLWSISTNTANFPC
ncbi:hypothetical protein [Moritella marina]|uniref:hypothetical protein n=1 Tax=Moritella marina TaxID=90736 RepID=UPI00370438FA